MDIQDGTVKFRVRNRNTDKVPVSTVLFIAGKQAPKGWLVCNGSAVSRTDYDELFEIIGTTYGAGDGSTTFNLPNLIDRFAEGGAAVGTKKEAGLPNIKSSLPSQWYGNVNDLGTWKANTDYKYGAMSIHTWGNRCNGPYVNANGIGFDGRYTFDASNSNPIYGSSDTVQPPSLVLLPIIKY